MSHKQPKPVINEAVYIKQRFSLSKRIFFNIVLGIIPILLLLILEMGLRLAQYGDDLNLFVTAPDELSRFNSINLDIGQRYFYYFGEEYNPKPKKDLFLKEKPEDCVRIFVMGASTTAGFPFGDNVSFPRILQRYLMETFPSRQIEVVNTAITSINSYTLLDFIDEILMQSPDLILVYAGHNEFYGPFGPTAKVSFGSQRMLIRLLLSLQHFKSYILFRNVVGSGIRSLADNNLSDQHLSPEFQEKSYIPLGSSKYQAGLIQFNKNLEGIIKKCQKAGVPIVLSELVSNIRDQKPFDSVMADTVTTAEMLFMEAKELERSGKYEEARKTYLEAKDHDPIRFRAPEDFNEIIRRHGSDYGIPVVPMSEYFNNVSPNGLIGNSIIIEHVHPTYQGYFLMAEAFYNTMFEARLIDDNWYDMINNPTAEFIPHWGYTKLDQVYTGLVIENLKSGWPFKSNGFSTITGKYLSNHFSAQNLLDSIALAACTNSDYSIQSGHLDLGKYYEEKGELEKALGEYYALIYSIPAMDMFYDYALNIHMKWKQFDQANQLMQNAVKFVQSAYTYKWLGQTYLPMGKIDEAIQYLILSYNMDPKDRQVLFNLTRACYTVSDNHNGDKYFQLFKDSFPQDPGVSRLREFSKNMR